MKKEMSLHLREQPSFQQVSQQLVRVVLNHLAQATVKNSHMSYETEPENLNYITSGKAATHDITGNLIDGLFENDKYGNLIPSLAKDWTVSQDGLTYTYKLRDDAKWYDSEGEEYADVTADDFVAGIKYAADHKSEMLYIIQNSIKGLNDYVEGKTSDFKNVGIKAVDDHTLQITLNQADAFLEF